MRFLLAALLALSLLGCGASSPDERLNQAIAQLQNGIEERDRSAVMDLLHPEFIAQSEYDQAWADRTLRLMFLRNQRINVLVTRQQTEIDPGYEQRAESEARVTLTGAERLIPNSAGQYDIRLLWEDTDGRWLLRDINWQPVR
jgi:Tfp pilus assembly protein PilP